MDNGVGYLRIDSFTSGTAVEFRNAVNSLTNQGATSLIFDLRDNSGENLNAALVATDYCVPSGLIAQSQDKGGNVTDLRMSDENEITLPMVCLVNGSTASGAELFANALRKMARGHHRGQHHGGQRCSAQRPAEPFGRQRGGNHRGHSAG